MKAEVNLAQLAWKMGNNSGVKLASESSGGVHEPLLDLSHSPSRITPPQIRRYSLGNIELGCAAVFRSPSTNAEMVKAIEFAGLNRSRVNCRLGRHVDSSSLGNSPARLLG